MRLAVLSWFSLSLRDVELIMVERGVVVTYETFETNMKSLVASTPKGFEANVD
jgi:transposase-like protein